MKIGIAYNLKNELTPGLVIDSEDSEEFDTQETIDALSEVFKKNGFGVVKLGAGTDIIDKLKKERVDFVFNIAEGYIGRNRESQVPAILEMLGIPHSGSDPLTLGLTLDKSITKRIAHYARIPVPGYCLVRKMSDIYNVENTIQYPMITKPAWEGSSKGIYSSSKVLDTRGLKNSLKILLEKYPNQPILVEEYISGREVTVGIIGNNAPQVLGLMEIENKRTPGKDFFYSLDVKKDWKNLVRYVSPPKLPQSLEEKIRYYAVLAFKEFGCKDVARMDFRISKYNKPFLLEINPLPGLSPEYADLVIMARKLGIQYNDLILTILYSAFYRYGFIKEEKNLLKSGLAHEKI